QSLNDLQQAVTTVARRASNLTQFVDAYRSIARLPEPKFKTLTAADFIERVRLLACQEWPQKHIDIAISIEPSHLTFTADEHMLEQVLINLLNNAEHAVLENPGERQVAIYAGVSQNGEVILSIADNGPAVSEELVRQIFVPFFTTKPRGSGVGLSLSRQILMLHGGRLSYRESDMGGACFDLYF
ncbi:MAG: hypothetical protein KTR17_12155, partial [Cellvibrionaceae bacterium]|nr:hypothetical protein [Cellvibrionaceae bacterium]